MPGFCQGVNIIMEYGGDGDGNINSGLSPWNSSQKSGKKRNWDHPDHTATKIILNI